jgi:hypothetical protein
MAHPGITRGFQSLTTIMNCQSSNPGATMIITQISEVGIVGSGQQSGPTGDYMFEEPTSYGAMAHVTRCAGMVVICKVISQKCQILVFWISR